MQVSPITAFDTVEMLATEVLANAPPRFALAGLSMGGIVAMEIIAQAPERVTRLALLDTNCMAELPEVAAGREPQIVKAQAGKLDDVIRIEMKPNYLASGPGRVAVMSTVMDMAMDIGSDAFVRQSRALQRRPDQQKTLRKIKVPTLVLCGREDELCPVKRHEFMAELIPGATLHIVDEAGHLPTLEQPENTNAALGRWLTDTLLLV